MGAYYTYLISSLPALNFNSPAPFGPEDFIAKCRGLVPEEKLEVLRDICRQETFSLSQGSPQVLGRWYGFETILRNELVRARSGRKKTDPSKFIRPPDDFDAQISHVSMAAYRSSSILEAERILDQARWDFMDSLSLGHYFDFDFIVIYILKLKILERWDKIRGADKEALFERTVGS
ncbi:MAG: DUF2764 family protein [Candidatus Omnitrophica bacterium]|nr:DUF2764 family protein [Candidatus Omnitrophota bacterium]MDD5771268.1 DUF2764 family protein [Candidatus Omnitrophota bacterium]